MKVVRINVTSDTQFLFQIFLQIAEIHTKRVCTRIKKMGCFFFFFISSFSVTNNASRIMNSIIIPNRIIRNDLRNTVDFVPYRTGNRYAKIFLKLTCFHSKSINRFLLYFFTINITLTGNAKLLVSSFIVDMDTMNKHNQIVSIRLKWLGFYRYGHNQKE